MSKHVIQCWNCGTRLNLDERNENDGDCMECGVELALDDYLVQAANENAKLRSELAALKAGQGEAVAWMLADAVGGSMLEFQRDLLLENQCRYGGEIVPLYTAPQHDAELVELLKVARAELWQVKIGCHSAVEAGHVVERIDAKLATLKVNP